MAYARTGSNTRYHSSSPSRPSRKNSDDLEELTYNLVNDFKRVVQTRTRHGEHMSETDVEAVVAEIRRGTNPSQCDLRQWQRNLPDELRNCPDSSLTSLMAYGNDPTEVQSIIEAKMNETSSDGNKTNKSLENIKGPLKQLKIELDRNKSPNLFKSIRATQDIKRANRLFFAEAFHFLPSVKSYTYAHAENAVKAIRDTDCENDKPDILLPMIKTFQDTDEIREHLEQTSLSDKRRNRSSSRHSNDSDDDNDRHRRRPVSQSIVNTAASKKPNPDNDDSGYRFKPLDSAYSSTPQSNTGLGRFAHLPKNDPPQNNTESRRFAHLPDDDPPQDLPNARPYRK